MELWAFLLLGVGLVFVVLEVFFPSFGMLGTIAAAAVVGGGFLAWKAGGGLFTTYVVLAFVLVPVFIGLGLKLLPKTPMGRRLVLRGTTFDPNEARAGSEAHLEGLVGKVGVSKTPLRPAGKVSIDGRTVDVVTRGELVPAGRLVRVFKVEGNRVFVEETRGGDS